jgi:CubicO group peptidase (beta-lactamase class C family)
MGNNIKSKKPWILWFLLFSSFFILLFFIFSMTLHIDHKIKPGVSLDQFKDHMDVLLPDLMDAYTIAGVNISLVKDSQIVWSKSYGYADINDQHPLTVDTPMSVQSISKSVTAWGVLKLVADGLLDLDAPVMNYLKDWQFPQTKYSVDNVTTRALLSHTAGMPLGDFTDVYAPNQAMPTLTQKLTKEVNLIHEPQTKFSYSNVGYHLLELVIENISGQSFSEYMASEILIPLGMSSSSFEISNTLKPYPPTGYDLKGKPVAVYQYPEKSSGGLFATVEDIARFAIGSMKENQVLDMKYIQMMYTPESNRIGMFNMVFDAYGFGHYLEELPNSLLSVSHGGQGNGIMTHFQVVPESGDAIIILTNSQRSWPLISIILTEWAQWRNFPSVGMGIIIWGHYAMIALISLLFSTSVLIVCMLIHSLKLQTHIHLKKTRLFLSIVLIAILIYSANQPYLFVTSVFPILSSYLAIAVFMLSLSLLASVLLSKRISTTQ